MGLPEGESGRAAPGAPGAAGRAGGAPGGRPAGAGGRRAWRRRDRSRPWWGRTGRRRRGAARTGDRGGRAGRPEVVLEVRWLEMTRCSWCSPSADLGLLGRARRRRRGRRPQARLARGRAGTVTSAGASAGCGTGSGAGASTGAAAAGRSASGAAGAGSVTGAGAVAAGLTSASAAGSTSATVATSRSAAGAGATSLAVAAAAFLVLLRAGLGGSSGWTSRFRPSRSALRRTRSAWASSMLEEWLLTPMPRAMLRSSASLLVRPSSLASSWTRIFPATCAVSLSSVACRHRATARGRTSLSGFPTRFRTVRCAGAGPHRHRPVPGRPGRRLDASAPGRHSPAAPGRARRPARGRCG